MSNETITHATAADLAAIPTPLPAAAQALPAIKPGHRLVPAVIGTPNRHQVAYIECPTWCAEDHMDEPSALEDITHYGEEKDVEVVNLCDPDTLCFHWTARIMADPASGLSELRAAHISLDDESADDARLTPDMAEELADDLVGFAAHLRQLARTVRTVNQASDELPPWELLSRTDLQSMPIAALLKVFGVTVEETVGSLDEQRVALVGEPGSMRLLMHPAAPQHAREDLTRTGVLAWYDARFGGNRD